MDAELAQDLESLRPRGDKQISGKPLEELVPIKQSPAGNSTAAWERYMQDRIKDPPAVWVPNGPPVKIGKSGRAENGMMSGSERVGASVRPESSVPSMEAIKLKQDAAREERREARREARVAAGLPPERHRPARRSSSRPGSRSGRPGSLRESQGREGRGEGGEEDMGDVYAAALLPNQNRTNAIAFRGWMLHAYLAKHHRPKVCSIYSIYRTLLFYLLFYII
jgi:hypothetical protein